MALYHIKQAKVALNTIADSADTFGWTRVSQRYTVFENSFLDGEYTKVWSKQSTGTATGVENKELSEYLMSVYADGDYFIHQTLQPFVYQKGKGQIGFFTGGIESWDQIESAIGFADNNHANNVDPYEIYNGLVFNSVDGVVYCSIVLNGVWRSVPQHEWNIDVLDGTQEENNPSGLKMDWTKKPVFIIQYGWLGLADPKFGIYLNGGVRYVHEFYNSGYLEHVFTRQPNFKVRYEIRSTGAAATMTQICFAVMSEGGREPSGFNQILSNEAIALPSVGLITAANLGHICYKAMRHQALSPYSFVRLVQQAIITLGNSKLKWSISLVPGTTEISLNGTPTALDDLTFTPRTESTLETYSFDLTGDDTVTDAQIADYIIEEGYIPDTGGGANPSTVVLGTTDNLISLGQEINGSRWCFLFTVQTYGTETLRSSLKFTEII